MRHLRGRRPDAFVLISALLLAACGNSGDAQTPVRRGVIGLYSSLPIAFNEGEDVRDLLAHSASPHWALQVMKDEGQPAILDTLSGPDGRLPLPRSAMLVLAQPRPLTAQENVALDEWVRGGGRVLMFVDPMLTQHSIFAMGDPRRPQDVAMLSPILARWGLALQFDEGQPAGERIEEGIPVNLSGRFVRSGKSGEAVAKCDLSANGLIAHCTYGKGRILAIADAALLEVTEGGDATSQRQAVFRKLMDRLANE